MVRIVNKKLAAERQGMAFILPILKRHHELIAETREYTAARLFEVLHAHDIADLYTERDVFTLLAQAEQDAGIADGMDTSAELG